MNKINLPTRDQILNHVLQCLLVKVAARWALEIARDFHRNRSFLFARDFTGAAVASGFATAGV